MISLGHAVANSRFGQWTHFERERGTQNAAKLGVCKNPTLTESLSVPKWMGPTSQICSFIT